MSVSETDADGFDWGTLQAAEDAPGEGSPSEDVSAQFDLEGEAATEPQSGDRPRNPDGTFAAKEPSGDDPEIEAILGKYGTTEKALKALQESQSYIGQLHQTQGDLQAQIEALTQAIQNPRPQQDFEVMLSNDPQQAALYALQVGDREAYARAKAEWNELSPGTPEVWEQNLQLQNRLQEIEARVSGVQAPIEEQQNLRMVASALQRVQAANPDFAQLEPMMSSVVDELAASGYDWVTPALESRDPVKAEAALSHVVLLARARSSGNLQDQARQAAQEHVAATEQAKREAIVGSASSSMNEPHERTAGEALWDQFGKFDIGRLRDS